ncbi:MAG: hypothetical protein NT003_02490 [Candidatus Magasanikbacteria bacterium]|nr:hypothetical protein [Candidatus Magasanikbacteria bacterium]
MIDSKRLRRVRDICPLSSTRHGWRYATRWQSAVATVVAPTVYRPENQMLTVVKNNFLTWRRTFTPNGISPTEKMMPPTTSRITIDEWAPTVWPDKKNRAGWKQFGMNHYEGIVFIDELANKNAPTKDWSSHARRHLAQFKKHPEIMLRLGTLEEVERAMPFSQVPERMHEVSLNDVRKHLKAHPESIDILVAESPTDGVIACFVAGNISEINQSFYICGLFKRGTEKLHAMVGLIEWWFNRSIATGIATLNFGHMVDPHPLPILETGTGYSNFKTHFFVRRVWWPGNFWKIRLRKK